MAAATGTHVNCNEASTHIKQLSALGDIMTPGIISTALLSAILDGYVFLMDLLIRTMSIFGMAVLVTLKLRRRVLGMSVWFLQSFPYMRHCLALCHVFVLRLGQNNLKRDCVLEHKAH
jgi:hypothetical protein